MADLSDVMNVLAQTVEAALYPGGVSGPTAPSVAGPIVPVYPGWPNPQQLDKDLPQGLKPGDSRTPIVHVNIYPWKADRNTTRYMETWQVQAAPAPTITAAINGVTVTLGGTPGPGQNIAILANGLAFVYQTVSGDTLLSAAAALAALINAVIPGTTSSGAQIILPATARIAAARVGGSGVAAKGIRNQERIFMAGIWAGSPALRDAVAKVVDPAISTPRFLTLPDGYAARIIYHGSALNDSEQKMGIYRRDLLYSVDYATTITEEEWEVVVVQQNITPANAPETSVYA
jgi:hypothetical protein